LNTTGAKVILLRVRCVEPCLQFSLKPGLASSVSSVEWNSVEIARNEQFHWKHMKEKRKKNMWIKSSCKNKCGPRNAKKDMYSDSMQICRNLMEVPVHGKNRVGMRRSLKKLAEIGTESKLVNLMRLTSKNTTR